MSDIPRSLQSALDRLVAEPTDDAYDSHRFSAAVEVFLHALCQVPNGETLLDEYGELIRTRTAKGTPYALVWAEGMEYVKRWPTPFWVVAQLHQSQAPFPDCVSNLLHGRPPRKKEPRPEGEPEKEPDPQLERVSELRAEREDVWRMSDRCSRLLLAYGELASTDARTRHHAAEQLLQADQHFLRIDQDIEKEVSRLKATAKACQAWTSVLNTLIVEGEDQHTDDCWLLLAAHREGVASVEWDVLGESMQAGAGFLVGQVQSDADADAETPDDQAWWHGLHDARPEEFHRGPVVGTKTHLGICLGGKGGKNERTLERKAKAREVWVIRHGRASFEAWFLTQRDFSAANTISIRVKNEGDSR
ncbi:MAG: hypothetical protein HQ567_11790 [Candidatus Nealsonbacteria bacterium]|nr:hypothetical protein [Candidatus Nealsonbacteria bacterium]